MAEHPVSHRRLGGWSGGRQEVLSTGRPPLRHQRVHGRVPISWVQLSAVRPSDFRNQVDRHAMTDRRVLRLQGRCAQVAVDLLQAAPMTAVATATATVQLTGIGLQFIERWPIVWGIAWATVGPVVIAFAPLISRPIDQSRHLSADPRKVIGSAGLRRNATRLLQQFSERTCARSLSSSRV